MYRRWVVGLLVVAAGVAGCNKGPSEDECKQLLDHMVDLEFKKSGAGGADATKGDVAKLKAAAIDAKVTEGFIEACTKKTPRSRVECAINATDDTGVARCDEGK